VQEKELVLFGGSFNPPTASHVQIAQTLALWFTRVVVVPCSTHPFKKGTSEVTPEHRITMVKLAFENLASNIQLDLSDFGRERGRRTFERQEQYESQGVVWHAIGSDLIAGVHEGRAEVQRWAKEERIWREYRWVIIDRPGSGYLAKDLPPNYELLPEVLPSYSSTQVREQAKRGGSLAGMVPEAVAEYIIKHRLYKN
jgi:nicotinate-nucleotide adenylyltransferase